MLISILIGIALPVENKLIAVTTKTKGDVTFRSRESKIYNALKPAKISDVIISDTEEKTALVVVPNDQLSLAIGKNGINVRLSVKLTGWKLDIINEDEYKKNQPEIQKRTQLSIADKIKLSQDKEDENLTIKKETGEPTGLTLAEKMKQSKMLLKIFLLKKNL